MEEQEIYEKKFKNSFDSYINSLADKKGIKIKQLTKELEVSHPTFRKMMEDPLTIRIKDLYLLSASLGLKPIETFAEIQAYITETKNI